MQLTLIVNGETRRVDADADTPLLWVLREKLRLTGTKFGCGIAQCGACSVHVDGQLTKSCSVTVAAVAGKQIGTIEGLSDDSTHAVQRAWIEESVPQCGYCQSGQIMAAAWLLGRSPDPSNQEIDEAMRGNLCRCGTYRQIRRAIHRAAAIMRS